MAKRLAKFVATLAVYASFIIAMVLLWVFPLWAFHHDFSLGIFAWLSFLGDDPNPNSIFYFGGYEIIPTFFGVGLLLTLFFTWLAWSVFRDALRFLRK